MIDAIVLPGCGARGAYQAGVLSTLPVPSLTVGTSAGALNALAHVHHAHGVWRSIRCRSDVMRRNWWPIQSIYSPAPLARVIARAARGPARGEAVVAVTDLATNSIRYYSTSDTPHGDLCRMALASASIPGIFPPVDRRYVDGGVLEIAPLKYAIDRGATRITMILGEHIDRPTVPVALDNIIDTCVRALDATLSEVLRDDLAAWSTHPNRAIALRIIQPPQSHYYPTLAFTESNISQAYELGKSWTAHNSGEFRF